MVDPSTNNLLDLKDHCLLCFRPGGDPAKVTDLENVLDAGIEKKEDDKVAELFPTDPQRRLCNRFLTLLSRHLNLPLAQLTVAEDGVPITRTIQKRWEHLIKAGVCGACEGMVQDFCNIYQQLDYIKMQLDIKLHELEKYIYFTDQEKSCIEGKGLLKTKWESEGEDSPHLFQLLKILRTDIVTKATAMMKFPVLSVPRSGIPEQNGSLQPDTPRVCHHNTGTAANEVGEKEHRPSITEDSGVSELSPKSLSICDEETEAEGSAQAAPEKNSISSHIKEYKVIRKVFRCKKCDKKFFAREKLSAHSLEAHNNPATTSNDGICLSTVSKKTEPPEKQHKIRKIAFICPAGHCRDKFLAKKNFVDHMNNCHPNIAYSFPWPDRSGPQQVDVKNAHDEGPGSKRRRYRKRNIICSVPGCPQKFHTADELVRHSQSHRLHFCSVCGESCQDRKTLATHEYKRHHTRNKGTKITCPRCGDKSQVFAKFFQYTSHFIATHFDVQDPLPQCCKCSAVFATKAGWEEHSAKCGHQSNNDSASKDVLVASTDVKPEAGKVASRYTCNICTLPCASFAALQTHLIARHDANLVFCNDCERAFRTSKQLEHHRAYFHLKLKVLNRFCKPCGKKITFKSIAQFNSHVKQHESGKPNSHNKKKKIRRRKCTKQCPICRKKFRSLLHHMRVHKDKLWEINERVPDESSMDATSSGSIEEEEQVAQLRGQRSPLRSLAERVKLRERNRSNLSEHGSDDGYEGMEEVIDTLNNQKSKRGRKRRQSAIAQDENSSARKKNINDDLFLPNDDTQATVDIPAPQNEPPMSPNSENEENSVESEDSTILRPPLEHRNPTSVTPLSIPSNTNTMETITPAEPTRVAAPVKNEPVESSISLASQSAAERLRNWLEATKLSQKLGATKMTGDNPTNHSSSGASLILSSSQQGKPEENVIDCIDLSDDDDDVDSDQKPDISSAGLKQRVNSWLIDRQFAHLPPGERSSQVDVITLD